MNLKQLSSPALVQHSKTIAQREREITLELIECIRECDRRKLWVAYKCGSINEFACKELGLSEAAASRRVSAMRLTRDVPEAKAHMASGKLTLSNAAKVQSFLYNERQQGRKHDQVEVLNQVLSLSQVACDRKLLEISPSAIPQSRERVVSPELRELKIVISEELYQKLQTLKGRLGHSVDAQGYASLLERMADAMLELAEEENERTRVTEEEIRSAAERSAALPNGVRVKLPRLIERAVKTRAEFRCEHLHEDGVRCGSQIRLEIDHIEPLAHGGSNHLNNLRLVCRNHNQMYAFQATIHGA